MAPRHSGRPLKNSVEWSKGLAFQKFGDHREIQVDVLIQYFPLANPNWLVVSTQLKNISQIGSFSQVGVNIKMFQTTT